MAACAWARSTVAFPSPAWVPQSPKCAWIAPGTIVMDAPGGRFARLSVHAGMIATELY